MTKLGAGQRIILKRLCSFKGLINYLEISALVLLVFCFKNGISDVFNDLPATGGDMGSHFWPLIVLKEYGFPNFNLRIWNPGNYAGEPLLIHYFPLPFIFMTTLSYFVPIGLAFNIITFMPGFLMAPAVWWSATSVARGLGATRDIARFSGAVAAIASIGVFFNDGNSMWGGNIFSLLAGQFAHQWAFVFFVLWIGAFPRAVSQGGTWLLFAALMFAAVVTSHGYVAIMMPVALLGLLFIPTVSLLVRFRNGFLMGLLGSALSAWYWWPLIDNSKWTTPYGLSWVFGDLTKEVLPVEIAPSVVLTVSLLLIFLFRPLYLLSSSRTLLFWAAQLVIGIGSVPVLASLGVVNVRTIPHVHYILCFVSASVLAIAIFRKGINSWLSRIMILVSLALPFVQWHLVEPSVTKARGWISWNYSGWTTKDDYAAVQSISNHIKGDFSDPRVVFEHDGQYNGAGTPRVFEMLPYFSGRSTTDGLYMQSTILAPHMFYSQATISEKPSCPFLEYSCKGKSFDNAVAYAPLLGIDTFILFAESTKEEARTRPDLELLISTPPWDVFKLKGADVKYTETLRTPPQVTAFATWRSTFWEWFQAYQSSDPFLMRETAAVDWQSDDLISKVDAEGQCTAYTQVTYDRISVQTNCPCKAHILKFAYHDSWRASGGEDIVLLSPGYMGIIPRSESFELVFGQKLSWIVSGYISLFAWILFFVGCLLQISVFRRKMMSSLSAIGIPTRWFRPIN